MRVRVHHTIGDLERDMLRIPAKLRRQGATVVRRNATEGNRRARRFAQQAAGPHGEHYYKRITAEQLGPLSWEYGPEGEPKSEFVGAGYRNAPPNRDLPKSADIIGPKFAKDAGSLLDRLFW